VTGPVDPQLERALAAGPPGGAWFLHGDIARLRDEAARRILDAALDPATRDFNLDQFRSEDVAGPELAAALAMPPMMAERRGVWVRDVQKLSAAARRTLLDSIQNPPSDLVVVITATLPKGSKAAFYRELARRCRTLEWSAPREAEIPGWAAARARDRWGLDLGREAAHAIAAAVGTDIERLDAELEKLAGLGRKRITPEDVRALIPTTRRIDRWSWLDLVTGRAYGRALRELDDLLTSERGVGLVAGLVEQHLLVGLAVEGGVGSVKKALSETGRGYLSWKAGSYAKQAAAWCAPDVDRALRHLHRADRLLKSGGGDGPVLAELLMTLEEDRRAAR